MPRFDFDDVCVDPDALQNARKGLVSYIEALQRMVGQGYTAPESSINAPSDAAILEAVLATKERYVSASLRFVFLVGIGGSSLGARAVYRALEPEDQPSLVFLEGIDPFLLTHIETHLLPHIVSLDEVLVIVVSKSGTTTETMANLAWLLERLTSKFEAAIARRVVAISDEGTPLLSHAQEKGWGTLIIPSPIGGRFSVFTAAGLFPLACVGVDVHDLVVGAQQGRAVALRDDDANPYLMRALVRYLWYTSGITTETLFSFHRRFVEVCAWHRQLTAESLGKQTNSGSVTLLPDCALGSEDLHAVFQLYFSLTNQSTTFLHIEEIPTVTIPAGWLKDASSKQAHTIAQSIGQGVVQAYRKKKKPFASIHLERLTPYELGAWMQGAMIETMLLAHLLGVNAFDQPNVEAYKQEMRMLLRP